MGKSRASIFDGDDGAIDISGFAPKSALAPAGPPPARVKAVSEAADFHSREPSARKPAATPKRTPRRYRTGRNVQFNAKALQKTIDDFYAITDQQGWVLGYTLERAVEALRKELTPK